MISFPRRLAEQGVFASHNGSIPIFVGDGAIRGPKKQFIPAIGGPPAAAKRDVVEQTVILAAFDKADGDAERRVQLMTAILDPKFDLVEGGIASNKFVGALYQIAKSGSNEERRSVVSVLGSIGDQNSDYVLKKLILESGDVEFSTDAVKQWQMGKLRTPVDISSRRSNVRVLHGLLLDRFNAGEISLDPVLTGLKNLYYSLPQDS